MRQAVAVKGEYRSPARPRGRAKNKAQGVSSGPPTTGACAGTSGQSVQKFQRSLGELPNKHFTGPVACENFEIMATPELLAKTRSPEHGMKNGGRVLLLRILRFFGRFHRLDRGYHNFQFLFVQGVGHSVNTLSALRSPILGRIEILIYRYIEHCHQLIKGVEAGMLAVILVIHDGAREPGQQYRPVALASSGGLRARLMASPYIVKIKAPFISLNLHNIT